MNAQRIVSLAVLLVLLPLCARAQEEGAGTPVRLLYGATIGLEGGLQSSSIPVYNGSPECGVFTIGQGFSPSLGGTLVFSSLFSERIGVSLTAGGTMYTGRFIEYPVDPVRIFDETTGEVVQLDREFRLSHTEWSLFADVMARVRPLDRLTIAAGPTFGYRLDASYTQTDNILGPDDYAFPDGQRQHAMRDGTPLGVETIDVGAIAQLLYDIPLRRGMILQPGVSFHANLTSPAPEVAWRKYSAGLRLSLLFHPVPVPPEIPLPPPVPEPGTPNPRLAASVELVGVDVDKRQIPLARVTVNEVIYRQMAPLLPAVFFERDTAVLPSRYDLLDARRADTFSIDNLAGRTVYEIQHNTLDIVGSRLRRRSRARITLVGSVSSDEEGRWARPRAEWVRNYLINVWGIDSSRITMREGANIMDRSNEATEDGRSDNRRVEMASNDPAILAPVVTERVARDFNPPAIRVNPAAEAEAGVRMWNVNIRQGGRVVAMYAGGGDYTLRESNLVWELTERQITQGLEPLEAELTVEDSVGQRVTAIDRVELQAVRRIQYIDGRIVRTGTQERISYTLVGFEFDRPELGSQNEEFIRQLGDLTRRGARIRIFGYTDRIGDPERNNRLSIERATRVENELRRELARRGIRNVTIETVGLGVETNRYPNDVAEGRVLSRGVNVIVDQEAPPEE